MAHTEERFLNRRLTKNEQGFTLIELLIVIVVLGILAAVVVFALGGVTGQSAQSACNADAKSVEIAAQAYQTQTGGPVSTTEATAESELVPTYLHTWPNNPDHYTITMDGTTAGQVDVTPKSGTLQEYDTQAVSPATGCYAVS